MFILHWLLGQVVLTYQQIRTDVTIPHVFTGVVLYTIVHTAAKRGGESARRTRKLFKSEMQRHIYRHVNNKHGGHPLKCEHPDCEPIKIMADPQVR